MPLLLLKPLECLNHAAEHDVLDGRGSLLHHACVQGLTRFRPRVRFASLSLFFFVVVASYPGPSCGCSLARCIVCRYYRVPCRCAGRLGMSAWREARQGYESVQLDRESVLSLYMALL